MQPIIKVENLSKQYHIGTRKVPYTTLRETLARAFRVPFKRLQRGGHSNDEMLWALKDVSFEIQQGEVVGFIGRNGAGKSTLLKVLSRITDPTSGRVEIRGRVSSLLEVGTGFHPELTGRENVYLNGTILGMTRTEIGRNFDEIVAFSEIEKFIDTPVKYYSSGMYLRLAFAVAAHLEPEILIVDEILTVGDAAFQKKCLGKMQDVNRQGRTVLFVSHNTASVKTLCTRGILLDGGRITFQGSASWVAEQYLMQSMAPQTSHVAFPEDPDLRMQFLHAELVEGVDDQGQEVVELNFEYVVRAKRENILLTVEVRNAADVSVFYSNDELLKDGRKRQVGTHTVVLTVPKYLLAPGDYNVSFRFLQPGRRSGRQQEHFPSERLAFRREEPLTRLSAHGRHWPGLLYLPGTWHYVERECQA